MYDRIDYVFILYFKVKFFAAFARKRLFRCFTGFYLAANELPQSALRLVRRALTDKISIAVFYDGSNYFDYRPYRHLYAQNYRPRQASFFHLLINLFNKLIRNISL